MTLSRTRRPYPAQAGSTLLETTVAVALFVTVLVPLGAFTTALVLRDPATADDEALRLARSAMEAALAGGVPSPGETTRSDGPWRIQTTVERDGELVVVSVRVVRPAGRRRATTLRTLRLLP